MVQLPYVHSSSSHSSLHLLLLVSCLSTCPLVVLQSCSLAPDPPLAVIKLRGWRWGEGLSSQVDSLWAGGMSKCNTSKPYSISASLDCNITMATCKAYTTVIANKKNRRSLGLTRDDVQCCALSDQQKLLKSLNWQLRYYKLYVCGFLLLQLPTTEAISLMQVHSIISAINGEIMMVIECAL